MKYRKIISSFQVITPSFNLGCMLHDTTHGSSENPDSRILGAGFAGHNTDVHEGQVKFLAFAYTNSSVS